MTDHSTALAKAMAALERYESNESWYSTLPSAEQEGRNYEIHEDTVLESARELADALRALVEQLGNEQPTPLHLEAASGWSRPSEFEDCASDRADELADEGEVDSVSEAFLSGALWAALVAEGRIQLDAD